MLAKTFLALLSKNISVDKQGSDSSQATDSFRGLNVILHGINSPCRAARVRIAERELTLAERYSVAARAQTEKRRSRKDLP